MPRQTFGAWLLGQKKRDDWVGQLANAAARDPQFPRSGSVKDVYERLNALQAEGDMFQAVEDAESEWLASADGA